MSASGAGYVNAGRYRGTATGLGGSPPPPAGNASPSNGSIASAGGDQPPSATRRSYTGELYGYYYTALSAWGGVAGSEVRLIDNEPAFVLGERYKGTETNQWTNSKVRAVSYYTYRNRLPAPLASGTDHDAGWGCMIRTGQMMMSEALRRVYGVRLPPQPLKKVKESELASLGGDPLGGPSLAMGSPASSSSGTFTSGASGHFTPHGATCGGGIGGAPQLFGLTPEKSEVFHRVAALFYDAPGAAFGIHAMTRCGAVRAKVPCGEWFTPTALARTLSAIVEGSEDLYNSSVASPLLTPASAASGGSPPTQASPSFGADLKDRLAVVAAYDAVVSLAELEEHFAAGRAVLLLVPVMLGMGQLDEGYQRAFTKTLECPQSLGIVGGRPKQSLYFIGHQRGTCFHLDPHTVQPAFVSPQSIGARSGPRGNAPVSSVDPSMLLCFYFGCEADHQRFQEFFFTELRPLTEYPLFSYTHQKRPSPAEAADDVLDDMDFDTSSSASDKTDDSDDLLGAPPPPVPAPAKRPVAPPLISSTAAAGASPSPPRAAGGGAREVSAFDIADGL